MAILNNNPLVGASGNQGGYNINNSLRFRSSASAYLSRTPASTSNQNTFTFSFWIKKGRLGSLSRFYVGRTSTNFPAFGLQIDDSLACDQYTTGGALQLQLITTQVFRDPSAWYHIVIAFDTTQATASNRIKFYVNGSQITAFSTATYPSQNLAVNVNTTNTQYIGADPAQPQYWDGYMAEFNFIDGSAKTPSDFGETDTTTGVWKPKAYTGTYGTNGFYLKFSDIATTSGSNAGLGKDFSGNSNYWTTNNISVTSGTTYDAMTDSPTNTSATVANYAVLNPLAKTVGSNTAAPSEANLKIPFNNNGQIISTMAMDSGKWYAEFSFVAGTLGTDTRIGIQLMTEYPSAYAGNSAGGYVYMSTGEKQNNSSQVAYGSSWTTNDIIGVAFDATAGTITFYKNNVSQGTAYSSITAGSYGFVISQGNSTLSKTFVANFGQRPFTYTPPTGYVALNTFNLPTSTIVKGNSYFDSTLYTGTGSSQSIVNAGGFSPDFVWVKNRSHNDADPYYGVHLLFNTNAGVGNRLMSQSTASEAFSSQSLTAFNSNGFSIGTDNAINYSGDAYVAWQWRGSDNSAVTNTSGTITSTVSANTTAGFSVVTYTGTGANATVGHGLGVAPKWVIIKARGATVNWTSYHEPIGNTAGLHLNTTGGSDVNSGFFNNTSPTSTTFAVGAGSTVNTSSGTYVAYCWAEIAGFSRFTSYTGNGSADGPFVYTGFRPKFVLIKRTDIAGEDWAIYDTSRASYNVVGNVLVPNLSIAEVTGITGPDILSNGFKLRDTNAGRNASGGTYIFMAFAENPFKNSLAR